MKDEWEVGAEESTPALAKAGAGLEDPLGDGAGARRRGCRESGMVSPRTIMWASAPASARRPARSAAEAPAPMTATVRPLNLSTLVCRELWVTNSSGRSVKTGGT